MIEATRPTPRRAGINTGQKIVIGATSVLVLGLLIVGIGAMQTRPDRLSSAVSVAHGDIRADSVNGKLTWRGTVSNSSAKAVTAPWVVVTIYNPAGSPVDTGSATPPENATIAAHGSLNYTLQFDTRGSNWRWEPKLIYPNSRALGM